MTSAADERRWTVLLADSGSVSVVSVRPTEVVWKTAARIIGCRYVELVRPLGLALSPYLLLVNEEGLFTRPKSRMNPVASRLYGTHLHGAEIVGPAVVVTEIMTSDGPAHVWLTHDEAEELSTQLCDLIDRGR